MNKSEYSKKVIKSYLRNPAVIAILFIGMVLFVLFSMPKPVRDFLKDVAQRAGISTATLDKAALIKERNELVLDNTKKRATVSEIKALIKNYYILELALKYTEKETYRNDMQDEMVVFIENETRIDSMQNGMLEFIEGKKGELKTSDKDVEIRTILNKMEAHIKSYYLLGIALKYTENETYRDAMQNEMIKFIEGRQ